MIPKNWLQSVDGSPFYLTGDEWTVSLSIGAMYTESELLELRRWLQELHAMLKAANGRIP